MADIPADPGPPTLAEDEKDKIIHVELPNLGGLLLMGTDMLESMGHELLVGDNISLNLEADTRTETVRLYKALSEGRKADSPLQDMLWGGYFGTCAAKFGVRWMFNCAAKE